MLTFLTLACLLLPAQAAPGDPTYWQDIRPLLRRNCTVCHSAKNLKEPDVSGGLALDSYEAILKGARRPIFQPRKSAASLIMQLLTTEDTEKRMPLASTPLAPESILLLRRWIDSGAKEGVKPDTVVVSAATATKRTARKLDVVLPVSTVPRGLVPDNPGARLELALKVGPLAPVTGVAFSPDGNLLATSSYRQVTIWDLASARPLKTLTNLLGVVHDIRFSPDGHILAVGGGQPSAKGDLRLFQVADWKLKAVLGGHDDVVYSLAFHPDGKHLLSASFDKTVRIWDLTTDKQVWAYTGHSDFVYGVACSPDGKWFATASKDRSLRVVDWATRKSRLTFSGMDQDVLAVAVSPDGQQVVSSGYESAIFWWNPTSGARTRVQGGHGLAVHELAFSKDGKHLASAGADKTVRLWNGSTGAPLRTIPVGSIAYAVAVSPNGKRVASGTFDGFVKLWDVASGRQILTLLCVPSEAGAIEWLAMTPEGFIAGSHGLESLKQWRAAGQAVKAERVDKALNQPAIVARALGAEKPAIPNFGK